MLWEELVSDGHVRAARLRSIQPLVIGIAVTLVLAGSAIFLLLYRPSESSPLAEVIKKRLDREQDRAYRGFRLVGDGRTYLADNERKGKTLKDALSQAALAQLIDADLRSLQATDKLASLPVSQVKQPPEIFWQLLWPLGEVDYMEGDKTFILGATVVQSSVGQELPPLGRWMGIFKKAGGQWYFAQLQNHNALLELAGPKVIDFGELPLTIEPFIPPSAASAPKKAK